MTAPCRRLGAGLLALGAMLAVASTIRAELPPPYARWQEFAAIASETSIPAVLGVVDRIEFVAAGTYVVRAGSCLVEVRLTRAAARSPDGHPIAGPSHVASVKVGEKKCQ